MIDTPIPVRAMDGDAHGQAKGLSDAALVVMAQEVIQRLSHIAGIKGIERTPVALDDFCTSLIAPTADDAHSILLKAQSDGATHEELCLSYIAGAARQLGIWWEEDIITFRDMAVAAGRMLHFLKDLRELAPPAPQVGKRLALFATVPGETHILGVSMAADMFRQQGWDIDLQIGRSEDDLCRIARSGGYPIIGISASGVDRIRALARSIVELRLATPGSLIFIGGNLVRLEPDIMVRTGADGAGAMMAECFQEMERLYGQATGVIRVV